MIKEEPKVISVFNDDGSHSHYALIDVISGEKLWSENPEECKAQGYPVANKLPIHSVRLSLLLEKLKQEQTPNKGGGMRQIDYDINCIEKALALLRESNEA